MIGDVRFEEETEENVCFFIEIYIFLMIHNVTRLKIYYQFNGFKVCED